MLVTTAGVEIGVSLAGTGSLYVSQSLGGRSAAAPLSMVSHTRGNSGLGAHGPPPTCQLPTLRHTSVSLPSLHLFTGHFVISRSHEKGRCRTVRYTERETRVTDHLLWCVVIIVLLYSQLSLFMS